MIAIRSAYLDLFNDARIYYARSGRPWSTVSFSATCLVAALTGFNAVALVCVVDAVSDVDLVRLLIRHKAWTVAASLGLIAAHYLLLRGLGVYDSPLPEKSAAWPRNAIILGAVGVLIFAAAVGIGLRGP